MKQKEAGVGTYLKKYIDSRNLVSAKGSGRAVASDARGLWFESSHRQTFITDIYLFTVNCIEMTKIMKRGREWPIKKHKHNKREDTP